MTSPGHYFKDAAPKNKNASTLALGCLLGFGERSHVCWTGSVLRVYTGHSECDIQIGPVAHVVLEAQEASEVSTSEPNS